MKSLVSSHVKFKNNPCFKTGCKVYFEADDLYYYGDAFILEETLLLKGGHFITEPKNIENFKKLGVQLVYKKIVNHSLQSITDVSGFLCFILDAYQADISESLYKQIVSAS